MLGQSHNLSIRIHLQPWGPFQAAYRWAWMWHWPVLVGSLDHPEDISFGDWLPRRALGAATTGLGGCVKLAVFCFIGISLVWTVHEMRGGVFEDEIRRIWQSVGPDTSMVHAKRVCYCWWEVWGSIAFLLHVVQRGVEEYSWVDDLWMAHATFTNTAFDTSIATYCFPSLSARCCYGRLFLWTSSVCKD